MDPYDLIVIGGGTAGMAAAIEGARRGLSVLVFDAAGPDYDKPCGEGLMPPGARALRSLGVDPGIFFELSGIKIYGFRGDSCSSDFALKRGGLGARREVLRRELWRKALSAGVTIERTQVTGLTVSGDSVEAQGVRGKHLIIASGSASALTRGVVSKRRDRRVNRVGLRRHARVKPWSSYVEVYWSDTFEIYVTPLSDSLVNVAILSWGAIDFQDAIAKIPVLSSHLKDAEWEDQPAGRAPLEHRAKWRRKGNIFVCGDAAGFIDAMTGEGNTLALGAGIWAARLIAWRAGWLYPLVWALLYSRYYVLTITMRALSRTAWCRRLFVSGMIRFPLLPRISVWVLTII
jgi:flavin-dependent dehydrogenase